MSAAPASFSLLHLHGADERTEDSLNIYHRMTNTLDLLHRHHGVDGRVLSWKHPQATTCALQADVVVLHNVQRFELEGLILRRRRAGRPTLFELGDDPSAPRSWGRQQTRSLSDLQGIYHLASQCDGLQSTSAALDSRFHLLSPCRAVLPNAVDLPEEIPAKPERFTIGWAGSKSHHEDLASIAPAVIEFCTRHPDVRLVLKGDEAMLHALFAHLPAEQVRIEPFGTPESYYRFLQLLHVGLAPLTDTAFNRGRTDLKLVEYAAAGAAVIAQASAPFAGLQPLVRSLANETELTGHLEALYARPHEAAAQARHMRDHLAATRGPDAVARQHVEWYRSHLPDGYASNHLPKPDASADRDYERLKALLDDEGAVSADALRAVLHERPQYDYCRSRLVHLLMQQQSSDVERVGRPLLRSLLWHDAALLMAQARLEKERRKTSWKSDRYLRSARIRAERAPRTPEGTHAYFGNLLAAAPMHYFALLYLQTRGTSPEERDAAAQRLALYR